MRRALAVVGTLALAAGCLGLGREFELVVENSGDAASDATARLLDGERVLAAQPLHVAPGAVTRHVIDPPQDAFTIRLELPEGSVAEAIDTTTCEGRTVYRVPVVVSERAFTIRSGEVSCERAG